MKEQDLLTPLRESLKPAGSEAFKFKVEEITKCVQTPVLMLGMTGYNDYREMASGLF